MKILICSLNYAPELTGIGKYSGEMAKWLAARGHNVKVIAAPPYYPKWRIWRGYSGKFYKKEIVDGVEVLRCPLWVPKRPGGLARLLHLFVFALSSLPALLGQIFWRPDVVWVVAPALSSVPGAWLAARLSGAPVWLHIQDYEVDTAFSLGLLRGKWLRSLVLRCESWLLRRFDRVSTISGKMLKLALGKGVAAARLVSFPNWVDAAAISPARRSEAFRHDFGVGADDVMVLYAGSMGAKQGLEILGEAARRLRGVSAIKFVFCGEGAGKDGLLAACAGLGNVCFSDLLPEAQFGALLASADIHLLPQRADAADLVMPSKLGGMLASGGAVIATALPGTEVAEVLAGCGVIVPPENPAAFAEAIAQLAGDTSARRRLGAKARSFAESGLAAESVLATFEGELKCLVARKRRTAVREGKECAKLASRHATGKRS